MTILKKTHSNNKLYPDTFYRTGKYTADHTTYGGEITLSDFEGKYFMSSMANKIARDFYFDKQCMKNIKSQKRRMYK